MLHAGITDFTIKFPLCSRCDNLNNMWSQPINMIQLGLWPLTVKQWTFVDFKFMFFMSVLQNTSPVTSLSSLLQALKFVDSFPFSVSKLFILRTKLLISIYYAGDFFWYKILHFARAATAELLSHTVYLLNFNIMYIILIFVPTLIWGLHKSLILKYNLLIANLLSYIK